MLITPSGGTLNVLELACRFKKLKVFVHTSTSYCHCNRVKLNEELYPAPHNPRLVTLLMHSQPLLLRLHCLDTS